MNTQEITNGNKLIAEFMGCKIVSNDFIFPDEMKHLYAPSNLYEMEDGIYNFSCDVSEIKYHSSWDWLMPVVEKVSNIVGFKGMDECNETEWYILKRLFDLRISANITSVWIAVIEFIKWYNENHKN